MVRTLSIFKVLGSEVEFWVIIPNDDGFEEVVLAEMGDDDDEVFGAIPVEDDSRDVGGGVGAGGDGELGSLGGSDPAGGETEGVVVRGDGEDG